MRVVQIEPGQPVAVTHEHTNEGATLEVIRHQLFRYMNMPLLSYASEITIPTLIVTGEKAHSRYFAEDAFKAVGSAHKTLVIVPGANHVDLYDNAAHKIPFDKFEQFYKTNLK